MKKYFEKARTHVQENKKIYISSAIGLLTGGGLVYLVMRDTEDEGNEAKQTVIAFKTGNVTQTVVQNLIRRGHPGNLIQCDQTGETFASQQRTAELLGVDPGNLSRHLNGKLDHVNGLTFTKLGEAS